MKHKGKDDKLLHLCLHHKFNLPPPQSIQLLSYLKDNLLARGDKYVSRIMNILKLRE